MEVSLTPRTQGGGTSNRARTEQPPCGRIYLDAGPSRRGWHRIATWLKCRHLFGLSQRLRVQFRGKKATGLGTLLHIALAHYYAGVGALQGGVEIDAAFVLERPELIKSGKARIETKTSTRGWVMDPAAFMDPDAAMVWAWEHDPRLLDRKADGLLTTARALFKDYLAHWKPRDRIRVLAVEVMLETQVTSAITGVTYPFTQRLDLEYMDAQKCVIIADHKTAADPNTNTYLLDGQLAGLRNFGRMRWGGQFRGVEINWIRTEPDKRWFYRESPPVPVEATLAFPGHLAEIEDEIAAYEATHPDPWYWRRTLSDACNGRYGLCDAFRLCQGRGSRPNPGDFIDV